MVVSISRPELFAIIDEEINQSFFGGIQDWYSTEWGRKAGCGPTCASNILAYLALTRPELKGLYGYEKMSHGNFTQHMENIYQFITPGKRGVNRPEMLSDGMVDFAQSRGITLKPHVFWVPGNTRKRPDVSEFIAFAQAGLAADCPLGFLNLSKGRVRNIQGWHWITITAAQVQQENSVLADASDEGRQIRFDLKRWYLTTRLGGGLVYFTYE